MMRTRRFIFLVVIVFLMSVLSSVTYAAPAPVSGRKFVFLNAGHAALPITDQENAAPWGTEKKAGHTGGTEFTSKREGKIKESSFNLKVVVAARKKLEEAGYIVVMARTSEDVVISNKMRAEACNVLSKYTSDPVHDIVHIGIHFDASSENGGAHTIYCGSGSYPATVTPPVGLLDQSQKLAVSVIDNWIAAFTDYALDDGTTATMARKVAGGVKDSDDYTMTNWSKVPAIYLEMGSPGQMTEGQAVFPNNKDPQILASTNFVSTAADAILAGVNGYFGS